MIHKQNLILITLTPAILFAGEQSSGQLLLIGGSSSIISVILIPAVIGFVRNRKRLKRKS